MKKLVFHLCSCLIAAMVSAQQSKYSLIDLHLQGKIRYIKETYRTLQSRTNPFNDSVTPPSVESIGEFFFNDKGSLVLKTSYEPGRKMLWKFNYKYDAQNNLIEEFEPYGNSDSFYIVKRYVYDTANNLIEKNEYYASGELAARRRYYYNSKQELAKEEHFQDTGELWRTTVYLFDALSRKCQYEYFDENGRLIAKAKYKYDQKGELVARINLYDDGTEGSIRTYTYDEKGNVVTVTLSEKNEVHEKYEYSYVYDLRGNWIKKFNLWNGSPTAVTEREIIYY